MKKGKILEIRGEIKDTNTEKMQEWKAYISVEEEHNKLVYKYCSMDSNSNFTNITFRDDYLLLVTPKITNKIYYKNITSISNLIGNGRFTLKEKNPEKGI